MNTVKRSVGRPRLGKTKVMLSIDPEIKKLMDQYAKKAGLGRSAYIESLIRAGSWMTPSGGVL